MSSYYVRQIEIRFAQPSDLDQLTRLRHSLWPESTAQEHARELELILARRMPDTFPLAVLVATGGDGIIVGFLEVRLRSHADSCNPSWPVGYVEGWFVAEPYRRQRIGAQLLAAAEHWARKQGCLEMASDAEIENLISQRTHEALGFEASARAVSYRKKL